MKYGAVLPHPHPQAVLLGPKYMHLTFIAIKKRRDILEYHGAFL